jgi:hypothetical protein
MGKKNTICMGDRRVSSTTSKELTKRVEEYKSTNNQALLPGIISLSDGIIGSVFKYYGMMDFPPLILEDIKQDCSSVVLLKALNNFDLAKKSAFSTYYTWKLKSFIRCRKHYYLRRSAMELSPVFLDASPSGCDSQTTSNLHEIITSPTYSRRMRESIQKEMSTIFNLR